MRPLEILLSLTNLLTFFVLAVPPLRAAQPAGYLAVIPVLAAGAQVLVEGPRWQMIPAYAISGVFFIIWLLRGAQLSGSASIFGLGLGALWLAVSVALPVIMPIFHFPTPGGPYEIGTLTYHWTDAGRPEIFSADPHAQRELVVQIWYPARGEPDLPRAPYLPDAGVLTALARAHHLPGFLFGSLKYVTTNAIPSAPVAGSEPSYPVLIFLEGLTGFRQMNTFQVEELVSHGYIVAAIDQPDAAALVVFPDGHRAAMPPLEQIQTLVRQSYSPAEPAPILNGRPLEEGIIPYFAQDVSFTLDQLAALNQADPNGTLTGRLDLQRAGVFGISLGGIVGAEACRLEPRLRACLIMDAAMPVDVVRTGLRQPAMWITRDAETMRLERQRAGGWSEAEICAHLTSMRAAFQGLPGDGYFVQLPGMFHINPTDAPSWSPLVRWLGMSGPLDAQRVHRIVNAYSLAFFDRYLKGQPAALLDGPSGQYPEVRLETR